MRINVQMALYCPISFTMALNMYANVFHHVILKTCMAMFFTMSLNMSGNVFHNVIRLHMLMYFTTLCQSKYSRLGIYGVDYSYFQMSCSYVMLIAMSNNSSLNYFKCNRSVGLVACAFGQIYVTLEIVRLAFSLRTAQDQIHEFRRLAVSAISGVSPG